MATGRSGCGQSCRSVCGGARAASWGALAQPVSNARRHRLVSPSAVVLENTVEVLLALGLLALQLPQLLVAVGDDGLSQLVSNSGGVPLSRHKLEVGPKGSDAPGLNPGKEPQGQRHGG